MLRAKGVGADSRAEKLFDQRVIDRFILGNFIRQAWVVPAGFLELIGGEELRGILIEEVFLTARERK